MRVSVCIPTYNQAKYLPKTIESILNQTILPDEIIISNDCSTDETKKVLDQLQNKSTCIKVLHQTHNLGIAKNVDTCLREAKGKYIVRIDSDDMLHPTYIEELSALMDKYPNAGYAHANVQEIDEYDKKNKTRIIARKEEFVDADTALKMSINGYCVAANIILFRREALENVHFIASSMNFAEDYYLSVSLANSGYGNVYSKNILSSYRVWSDSGNVRQKRKLDEINGLLEVSKKILEPAFLARNWNVNSVLKRRTSLAIQHANSLGWKIYTKDEKDELKQKIYELSSTYKVQFYVWCYLHGFGSIFTTIHSFKNNCKRIIKKLVYR